MFPESRRLPEHWMVNRPLADPPMPMSGALEVTPPVNSATMRAFVH
jgi:hypothetical protein